MARIRSIKPNLFGSYSLAKVPVEARFLFIGLFCEADDEGLLVDSPKRIAGIVFPHERRGAVRHQRRLPAPPKAPRGRLRALQGRTPQHRAGHGSAAQKHGRRMNEAEGVVMVLKRMLADRRGETLRCVLCGNDGRFRLAMSKPVCERCWSKVGV